MKPAAPTDTANDPAHYTKQPHEYGDCLIRGRKLGGPLQRDLIYWIERRTWGDARRPEWAALSLATLAKLCGGVERKNVALALVDLEKRGIIESRNHRQGCNEAKLYKLRPDRWHAAEPYTAPAACPAPTPEPAEEERADQEPELPAPAAGEPETTTVEPGRISPARPILLNLAGIAAPVQIRIVYASERFDRPIAFRARTTRTGHLHITARPAEAQNNSEKKANTCSRARLQVDKTAEANKRLAEFSGYISRKTVQLWERAADAALIARVIAATQGAPLETFTRVVENKFPTVSSAQRHAPGLLLSLAQQAARDWQAVQQEQERHAAAIEQHNRLLAASQQMDPISDPADDPEMSSEKCRKCGGTRTIYQSGFVSECRCAAEKARGNWSARPDRANVA